MRGRAGAYVLLSQDENDDHAGEASKPLELEEFVRNQETRLLRPQPEPNHSMANKTFEPFPVAGFT